VEIDIMIQSGGWSRRKALGSIALPLIAGLGAGADPSAAQQRPSHSKVLVAYFSRTGNTRVIANQIRRARSADVFEIEPAEPYPEDYEMTVSQAQRERDKDYRPPLTSIVANIDSYEVVFLGFPIWGTTAPPVIRSFLAEHDLSGKVLVPFVTHGGYGRGESLAVVASHAQKARLFDELVMQADQERETLSRVTRWLSGMQTAG
jgi:flavodoxin